MSKTKNTIKINGHLYDAATGALISHGAPVAAKPVAKSVTGVISPAVVAPSKPHSPKPTFSKPAAPAAKRKAAPSIRHATQHSQTLMRHTVKKPAHNTARLKAHSHTGTLVKNPLIAKPSARRLDERRLKHAQQIGKSQAVSRFGAPHSASAYVAAPKQDVSTATHPPLHAPQPIIKHPRTTSEMLQHALNNATSHKQPAPKKHMSRRQRIASFGALTVITAVLLSAVTIHSLPVLKVHMASARAGFAASLPGYKPAGFHLGDLNYGAGVVAMNFKSNSDESRKFTITQKASSWDSDTLRDIFVQNSDKNFRSVEAGGRTLFIYNQNNATWVDHGVWYQVQSTGALNNSQLADIAKSL